MGSELWFLLKQSEALFVVALVPAFVALCTASFIVRVILAFIRLRGRRSVVCPENGKAATIQIRAVHGAVTNALDDPVLLIRSCTRWREKRKCAQRCLESIL